MKEYLLLSCGQVSRYDMRMQESILEIIRGCATVELATNGEGGYPDVRTILNADNKDATDLNLHFLTFANSHKVAQIAANPRACLYYYNQTTHHVVRLYGIMSVITGAEARDRYWRNDWIHSGWKLEDPNIIVLAFEPKAYKFYIGNDEKTGKLGGQDVRP
ncbi:MAG: pyridoxamine 5'-phosphate oxidase family protein [Alphaproteobacteria bacterium]|nr:pyridoxamine 5'-phosphate oxidase family protein [Alphaproteobacteria bacterium]